MEGENNPEKKWTPEDKEAFERGMSGDPAKNPRSYPKPKKGNQDDGIVSKLWKAIK